MQVAEIISFFDLLCKAAAKETLPRFRNTSEIINKHQADFDPVTAADQNAESAIRSLIIEHYPDHGILGEEHGTVNPSADYHWIIDPIDGTRAFISGVPVWGTLIGLYKNGFPVAGVMDQPYTNERFICDGEKSLFLKDGQTKPLSTSTVTQSQKATLMTCDPRLYVGQEKLAFENLEQSFRLSRYSADCYAFAMLAAGQIELVVETGLQLYDIAALIPLVEKAGGVFTDWEGNSNPNGGRIIAAANSDIHAFAMEILSNTE